MRASAAAGRAAIVVAGFVALFLALFAPVLVTHRFIGDPVDQLLETLPAYLGNHAVWEPRMMLGYPLGADPNQAHFYPLALLRAIPDSFDFYEIAAFVLAACGTFGLVRATTSSWIGATVAAVVFSLGGFMIAQAGHVSIVEPAAWVPYLFWSLTEMRSRARAAPAAVACIGATALAILAGQPQVIVDALFFALPYVAVVARRADDGGRAFAVRALASLVLGIGCASIALVPEAELFGLSTRVAFSFERFQEFTVPVLQQPIRLFFPYALGNTSLEPYAHSTIDIGSFAEMSDYAGIGGVLFAVLAIRYDRRAPFALYWTCAAAAALVLATGNQLALGWVTYRIPLFGLFRAPGRVAAETDLAIAVLAGIGIAAIESGRVTRAHVVRACRIVGGAMALTYLLYLTVACLPTNVRQAVVSGSAALDASPVGNPALVVPVYTFACVAAASLWWSARPASAPRAVLFVAVVLADMLGFAGFGYWRAGAFGHERLAAPAYASTLRTHLEKFHQRVLTVPLPGDDSGGIGPNLNLLWNVSSLRGYTPLQLRRTQAFYDSDWNVPVWPLAAETDRTLDLAAVRYVIVVEPQTVRVAGASVDPVSIFMRAGTRWRFVDQIGRDTILENAHALPRAWLASRILPAREIDVRASLRRAAFDPRATAYVEGLDRERSLRPSGTDSADVSRLADDRMDVAVRCAAACFLVTSDATYPGWTAAVDGRATPIHATDGALRGVAVPAGRHDVAFLYAGASYAIGSLLTNASVATSAVFAFALFRRARSTRGGRGAEPSPQ